MEIKSVPLFGGCDEVGMYVAEDCVVFIFCHGDNNVCFCHHYDNKISGMIGRAALAGKNKIVIIGDCAEHGDNDAPNRMAKFMRAAGMQYAWIGWGYQLMYIRRTTPNYVPLINSFAEVGTLKIVMDTLAVINSRREDAETLIAKENRRLAGYPYIFKVNSLLSAMHRHSAFSQLFAPDSPSEITCGSGMLCLLDPEKDRGKLLTKSLDVEFTFEPDLFYLEHLLKGTEFHKDDPPGIRINVKDSPQLMLFLRPGEQEVNPHRPVNAEDFSGTHYVPMHQRLRDKIIKQ